MLKKKVFKLSIPLLAKAKLTVGAGLNSQTYKSIPDQSDLADLDAEGFTEKYGVNKTTVKKGEA